MGQFHYRAPSKMFWRSIRGMVPHKTARGAAALDRLKAFDGCPHPYDKKKRLVVPSGAWFHTKQLVVLPHWIVLRPSMVVLILTTRRSAWLCHQGHGSTQNSSWCCRIGSS